MSDYTLTAAPPLGGHDAQHGAIRLRELTDLAILSIALPLGREDASTAAITAAFEAELPAVGHSAASPDGRARLLRLGSEQLFVLFPEGGADGMAAALSGVAYITDQSDVWVGIDMSGAGLRTVLERICPLDLDPAAFAIGRVARTAMEHMGTLILRSDTERFTLLAASSSARSFLHALETSIRYAT